ncbi:MAG: FadR family transcriptional regulator [Ruminococcaceae bacterium]|nr:FadR family transcriptional regulator [Oscillospiraceae bacterium]
MQNNQTEKPAKQKKLYIKIYDEICNYIKDNNLNPGDKLPTEAEMTQMFGVGRSVLREAIKSLEITGVITSHPGIGITICKPRSELSFSGLMMQLNQEDDENLAKCIGETRKILEMGLIRQAFDTIDNQQLSLLEAQVEVMRNEKKNIENSKLSVAFLRADAMFHSILFQHAGNPLASAILDLFWGYDRYIECKAKPHHIDRTIKNHSRILDALKLHDYDMFHEAMFLHFSKLSNESE